MKQLPRISAELLVVFVVGAGILGYFVKILLTRIIGHIVEVSLGLFLGLGVYIACVIWLPGLDDGYSEINDSFKIPSYAFIDRSNWKEELVHLSSEKSLPSAVFPDSFVLSDSIDGILELVSRDFILSWYSKFTRDKVFSSSVDHIIRGAISELSIRLKKVEWADFLVGSVMPLVTDHFSRYVSAVTAIREKSSGGQLTQSKELDHAIAAHYNRQKLHQAVSLKNFEYETHRKKWLVNKTSKILPYLLATGGNELDSKVVNKLTTEIIANSVLFPVLKMISDPDFWNQIVIRSAGSTIQDQNKVRRLREALDQHTAGTSTSTGANSTFAASQRRRNNNNSIGGIAGIPPRQLRFSPNADQHTFDKFIRNIYKCQSLAEARQTRYYIAVQLQRNAKNGSNKAFESRLEQAKLAVDRQIRILSGEKVSSVLPPTTSSSPPPPQIPGTKSINSSLTNVTTTATNALMNTLGRTLSPSPMATTQKVLLNQTGSYTNSTNINISSATATTAPSTTNTVEFEDYSLLDILNDPACSLYFMEYMDQRRHTDLLQFWLTVNSLRKPGDDINYLYENTSDGIDTQHDPLGGLHIAEDKADVQGDTVSDDVEKYVDDGTSKDDIIQIYNKFFIGDDSVKKIPEITPESIKIVGDFVNNQDNATKPQYIAAHKAILETQVAVYKTIEERYLAKFKKSDLYLKYLASNPPPINRMHSSIDDLQLDAITNEDTSAIAAVAAADEKVVQAVEEAFEDIMSGVPAPIKSSPSTDNSKKTTAVSVSTSSRALSGGSLELKKRALFDSDEELDNDGNEDSMDSDFPEVHLAAPGDLGLTEAISILSEEIENLYNQEELVGFLLKKAELTNNQGQLRILQKSHASLEREIQRKELQRQQYIVQESDNSLYGKSDIQIQSYVHGVEDGGEFVLYIIEVQKFDIEGNPTAGWIVDRRYSQFFALHQHLREQFPRVRKLDFPRKRVLLKFQPKTLVDSRRIALERYLKELLKLSEVCQSKAFRLFLSSETFSVDSVSGTVSTGNNSLANSSASLTESEDNSPGLISSSSPAPTNHNRRSPAISPTTIVTESVNDGGGSGTVPISSSTASMGIASAAAVSSSLFIQPICDLFIQVFGVGAVDNWLRGRAVVVVLQQLLGGTIEKKVREAVSSMTSVRSVTDLVQMVRDSLWPGGSLKQPSPPRSESDKIQTRHEAMLLLHQLIHGASARVLGGSSSRYAARNIFGMYQNEILNTHLVYSLLDMLFSELFPELSSDDN